jgi:hypothetical protein
MNIEETIKRLEWIMLDTPLRKELIAFLKEEQTAITTIDLINERLKQNFTDAQKISRIKALLEDYYADQE